MNPFISIDDLGNYLRHTFAADDPLALMAVQSACDLLRSMANQQFDLVDDETVALDSDGRTDTLLLPELPLRGVSSVVFVPTGMTLVLGKNYVVDLEAGAVRTIRRQVLFLPGRQIYAVTYSHGYEEGAFPHDLTALAVTVAARFYDQGLAAQETIGGHALTYASSESVGLTKREHDVLAGYSAGRRR